MNNAKLILDYKDVTDNKLYWDNNGILSEIRIPQSGKCIWTHINSKFIIKNSRGKIISRIYINRPNMVWKL